MTWQYDQFEQSNWVDELESECNHTAFHLRRRCGEKDRSKFRWDGYSCRGSRAGWLDAVMVDKDRHFISRWQVCHR
jgi:hypothetical protein